MNIQPYISMFVEGTFQTLYMTIVSTIFAYVLGLPLGVLVTITAPNGILPKPTINKIAGWIVNVGRSIPFIILMIALLPTARLIVGTAIGPTAAIVPLVIGSAPFVARMVETSLEELDNKVIESAKCMGATNWQIITKVMIPEAIPSLVRGASITAITLIGYSAMAGAVGGKGLGDIAIRYGYYRYEYGVMLVTIVLLVIIVQIIQLVLDKVARKIDKKIIL
jgi:D-methionine transport system permease protein